MVDWVGVMVIADILFCSSGILASLSWGDAGLVCLVGSGLLLGASCICAASKSSSSSNSSMTWEWRRSPSNGSRSGLS